MQDRTYTALGVRFLCVAFIDHLERLPATEQWLFRLSSCHFDVEKPRGQNETAMHVSCFGRLCSDFGEQRLDSHGACVGFRSLR